MQHSTLRQCGHRPWPLPPGPWVMEQRWEQLLFAHWRYPAGLVRPLVPESLPLDLWEGAAWVSVVPFVMRGVRARCTPALPWLSAFAELNVRTYVTVGGKPGVYFFSLDAANPVAVRTARRWFHLPYFDADMRIAQRGEQVRYRSRRTHRNAPAAELGVAYQPEGYPFIAQPGTLEHFLAERYCLYSVRPDGQVMRGEIHHPPWVLQQAEATFTTNSMLAAAGLPQPEVAPLLHVAADQRVIVWAPKVCAGD